MQRYFLFGVFVLVCSAHANEQLPTKLYQKQNQLTYYLVGASLTSTVLLGAGFYTDNNHLKSIGLGVATGTACAAAHGYVHTGLAWFAEVITRLGITGNLIKHEAGDRSSVYAQSLGVSTVSSIATYAGYRYYKKIVEEN